MANEHLLKSYNETFEVEFADPAHAERTWVYDDIHYNRPMPLLTQDIFAALQGRLGRPPVFVNGYAFALSSGPTRPGPEMEGRNAFEVWESEFQPAILSSTRRMRSEDYDALSATQLAAMLPDLLNEAAETHYLTLTTLQGFLAPGVALIEFLQAELGDEGATLAMTLLQGEANQTTGADAVLGRLAQQAGSSPYIAEALKAGNYDSIEGVEGGAAFMAAFGEFIDTYGWRAESWSTPHLETWAERPEQALRIVARYIEDPKHAPAAGLDGALQRRESTLRDVEARLPADKLATYRELLQAAALHVPKSEERHFAQLLIYGSLRAPLVAMGRKLADAGVIDAPNDVFHLSLSEIAALTAEPMPRRARVTARKADLERWQELTPPLNIGASVKTRQMTPAQLQFMRLFRGPAERLEQTGTTIKGMGASRGSVRARARVIRDLSEADRLQSGDVLVCETTSAPWTPLFAIAGAVVTDSGGILSHSAICAREYGIPCVVGTSIATRQIPDGAMISVDGVAGTVEIVS
jgi:phosphohistidine swiveling domain-containing protein